MSERKDNNAALLQQIGNSSVSKLIGALFGERSPKARSRPGTDVLFEAVAALGNDRQPMPGMATLARLFGG